MSGYLHLYEWADSLTECGGYNEVGVCMIAKLKGVIREAYKEGFKDAEEAGKLPTQRVVRNRDVHRLSKE